MAEFPINCFSTTANREDLTVRGKSAECLMEHCRSAAPDFWVLTYTFRPIRKTFFVYVRITKAFVLVCTFMPMYMGLTKQEVRMAGYWPRSFFACLWTSMAGQALSIKNF